VDVAAAIGAMDEGVAKEANELGFRVRNMIGRLK
jgi:hypothetical protein